MAVITYVRVEALKMNNLPSSEMWLLMISGTLQITAHMNENFTDINVHVFLKNLKEIQLSQAMSHHTLRAVFTHIGLLRQFLFLI